MWTIRAPSSVIWPTSVGLGGAPPVVTVTGRGKVCASGWLASEMSTVGAALKCVMPSSSMSLQISAGSTARRQTWCPPTAVTPHVVHHPLQWNIGSVHRYTESRVMAGVDDLGERVEVGAAMRVHHALRATGRARGVVDRDHALLVVDPPRTDRGVGAREQLGVRRRLERSFLADVVDRHDLLEVRAARGIEGNRLEKLRVRDQNPGARVTKDGLDLGTREAGVDRDEDGVGEWHGEVSDEELGDVREQIGDAVAGRDPGCAQRAGEPLGVGSANSA